MRPSRVLVIPIVALGAFFLARNVAGSDALVNRITNAGAFFIAAAGCAAAAVGFDRGDYLRRAWLFQAASYAALLVPAIFRHPGEPRSFVLARVILVFCSNVFGVIGTLVFARAHRVAGLELPWSPGARRLFIAAMAIAAIAAAGPPIVINLPAVAHGDLEAWSGVLSAIGDVFVLALIAPLFMTALALRGGVLVWPWGLYTAATFCWLIYDAQDTVTYLVPGLSERSLTIVTVPLRVLACALTFGAAWVQRQLTTGEEPASARAPISLRRE
jgi:hypothetical protein